MGIWIAAAVTSLAVIAVYGLAILFSSPRMDRYLLVSAFLVALPLQPLAFFFVRVPLNAILTAVLGAGPVLTAISTLYAPLTEEPAKWLVLLVPAIGAGLKPGNAVKLALATGLGFGIGEIWFIATQIAPQPEIAEDSFLMFGGFMIERAAVCFLHGALVSFAFKRFAEQGSLLVGGMIGMALHFMLNLPVFLSDADLFGLGPGRWLAVNAIWIAAFVICLGVVVARMLKSTNPGSREAVHGERDA